MDGTGSGSTATTTATGFTYPAYGAAQPHAPTGESVAVNGGTPTTSTLNWAGSGAQPGYLATVATGGTTKNSYTWDGTGAAPGQLFATVTGSTTTSYRYDASGNLLVVQDGATSTLYLPGEQITASGTAITGTVRYYTFAGKTIAARTSSTALDWLLPNAQGTATTFISTTSQAVTRRYYTPYGVQLGTPPAWPGNQGYLGGTTDAATKLTDLGAREYNPATPLFISPDPILNPAQPADLNPYAYAFDNPATLSDPTGLLGSYPTPDGSSCVGSLQSCAKVIATQNNNTPGPGTGSTTGGNDPVRKPPPACGGSILNCLGFNSLFTEDTATTQGNDLFGNEPLRCAALAGGAGAITDCVGGLTATASGKTGGQSGSSGSGLKDTLADLLMKTLGVGGDVTRMALQVAADESASAADAAEGTNAADDAEAIAGNKAGWAQRMAAEKAESDDITGNVGDAVTQAENALDGLRDHPPADWITESPVHSAPTPELTSSSPMAAGGIGLESAFLNAAIIGRIIWMAVESMGGGDG